MHDSSEPTPLVKSTLATEQSYLGNLMLSIEPPHEWIENIGRNNFLSQSHQLIFHAIQAQIKDNGSATPGGTVEFLRDKSAIQTAGGEEYIYEVIEQCGTGFVDITQARNTIVKRHKMRCIGETANRALKAAFSGEAELEAAEAETRELLSLLEKRRKGSTNIATALDGVVNGAKQTFMPAVRTGWSSFDKCVRLSPGRLIVLGARPGVGKTTLSTQLSMQVLKMDPEAHVLYCSVEMDPSEIGLKALSMVTGTNCVTPFQEGNAEEIKSILWRAGHHSAEMSRLHVVYTTKLEQLVNHAHQISKKHKIKMIVCDFLSSMQPMEDSFATKSEAIGSVSKRLKALARELEVPVLACSQLNRGTAVNRRPTMKDLRDSGEIEQDADIVMLLSKPVDEDERHTTLAVEKNRFGIPRDYKLEPELQFHRFQLIIT
ncbi:MAG: putative ATP-dependent helicase [Prokaryotic dsDNA virus sp.]|nr:MAG: putative ATP-dependent helicase [Prokaryotic dsDNA virus sp.]